MDPDTEIATGFTVAMYQQVRGRLDTANPETADWTEVFRAFRRRLSERFLRPIKDLERYDNQRYVDEDLTPTRPGFAILALDCLLIDALQSFREGRVSTGEMSPAASFRNFLRSPRFGGFTRRDRDEFYHYVRNGLLHNGETRGDWKVRIDTPEVLTKDRSKGSRTINRRRFHAAVLREFRQYRAELRTGSKEIREKFLRRMDAISGLRQVRRDQLYFAYGSNLLEAELRRSTPEAEGVGVAFLPQYRLVFNKHSLSRGCDAADIEPDPASMVWGYVYRLSDSERDSLRERETGYADVEVIVSLVGEQQDEMPLQERAFTFVGGRACPNACGPGPEYANLILEGAQSRGLPALYREKLQHRTGSRLESNSRST